MVLVEPLSEAQSIDWWLGGLPGLFSADLGQSAFGERFGPEVPKDLCSRHWTLLSVAILISSSLQFSIIVLHVDVVAFVDSHHACFRQYSADQRKTDTCPCVAYRTMQSEQSLVKTECLDTWSFEPRHSPWGRRFSHNEVVNMGRI